MFRYTNRNPYLYDIEDCTVRCISCLLDISWDKAYQVLSNSARKLGLMMSSVKAIEKYLDNNYKRLPVQEYTVGEFIENHPKGYYAITMRGHITALKDGINYDTFDSSDRAIWGAWKIK